MSTDFLAEVREALGEHGESALRLAYHAALPVVLDVGLLNLLRVNFFLDPPDALPYEAEAELLLSPLFREVSDGLYEIEPDLRNLLLTGLYSHDRYGARRVRRVAALLEHYTDATAAWRALPSLEAAQRLTAVSFLDPDLARLWLDESEARATGAGSSAGASPENLGREWHVAMRRRVEDHATVASIDDALSRAKALLRASSPEVRLTGIRTIGTLTHLPEFRPDYVVTLLCEFVKDMRNPHTDTLPGPEPVPEDVQAALTLLGTLHGRSETITLADADLTGANLAGLDFRNANFRNVRLKDVTATGINLTGASFVGVALVDVSLDGARLDAANLHFTDMVRVSLRGVSAEGSDIRADHQEDVTATDATGGVAQLIADSEYDFLWERTQANLGADASADSPWAPASGPARNPTGADGPPELPGYQFLQHIGTGGNSQVYLYEQALPRRKVAVKVLNDSGLTETARRRFTAEANVTAGLTHRHIVQVFEANVTADGRPYLVMPYYPQPNLSVRARRAHFSVAEVLRIGIQIGSAVETSHRNDVLHRDIKPQNILTDAYGEPALTDFGIATTKGGDGPEGLSVPWSPPEILYGTTAGDERSDVYSLGATLWHLLVGRSPFEQPGGDNAAFALMGRIKSDPPPRTGRADVPESLERLLRQAMAKDPAARPQTALDLIRGLQTIEQELRLPLTRPVVLDDFPAGNGQQAWTATRHHPVTLAYGAESAAGRATGVNGDSYLAVPPLFAVADGGSIAGDLASRIAIETLAGAALDHPMSVDRVLASIHDANRAVANLAEGHEMRTAIAGLALLQSDDGDRLMALNVGNSRVYRLSGGRLRQVTTDKAIQEKVHPLHRQGFIDRDEALAWFTANLGLPVGDPARRLVCWVHGEDGVGKSALLGEMRGIAESHGALCARADEPSPGLPDVMNALATDLRGQGVELQGFTRLYATYREVLAEAQSDPGAPEGFAEFIRDAARDNDLTVSRVDLVNRARKAEHVRAFLTRKFPKQDPISLLVNPVDALTPAFVRDLYVAVADRPLALFFDAREWTNAVITPWLGSVLEGRHGELPANIVVVTTGQDPLDDWNSGQPSGAVMKIPLRTTVEVTGLEATHALGTPAPRPNYWILPAILGDRYLLCSDGLYTAVPDDRLAGLLTSGAPADAASALLAAAANSLDDVTLIVVDVGGPE